MHQMTTEETIAFLEGHQDATFELAKQLANAISYENGPELNALRMWSILQPVMMDRMRLDWLESCRVALNAHCGSTHGWEVIRSHLVNRLMLRTPEVCEMAGVDVHDTSPNGLDVRAAIDAARAKSL